MNESTSLITVKQLPVIQEELRKLKDEWDQKAADAAKMVCTDDTVQTLKGIRAEMRKEFEAADIQRKAAKAQYLAPWEAVEAVFKECVKDSFLAADAALKDQISTFEDALKKECREKVEAFFNELAAMEHIDFLTFDKAMEIAKVKITMADTARTIPTRLQDAVAGVISQIAVGMEQIGKMDDPDEIMAEFKICLDVGKAVSTVQDRKRRVKEEQAAAEARRAAQERFKAAEVKTSVFAPPVESAAASEKSAESDPVFETFTFTVYGARKSQLIKIREFMKEEGINYG